MSNGLVRRKTYEEIANIITNKPPKLKYPNRDATALFNSFPMQQFLGDGSASVEFLEKQKNNMFKQELINNQVKSLSNRSGYSTPMSVAFSSPLDIYEDTSLEEIRAILQHQKQMKETRGQHLSERLLEDLQQVENTLIYQASNQQNQSRREQAQGFMSDILDEVEKRSIAPSESEDGQQQQQASSSGSDWKPTNRAYVQYSDIKDEKERRTFFKHMIEYDDNIKFWKRADVSENDLKLQFYLRGLWNSLPDQTEYKKKGKGKGTSYKEAIVNIIEEKIKNKSWNNRIDDESLRIRVESWNNLLSMK